jgi:hypothetical protein
VLAFEVQGLFSLVALVVMLGVKGFAFVNALSFSPEAYQAAGKATKNAWAIGLGAGFVAQILLMGSPLNIIHLAFIIAALVYLADVRPALSQVMGRR